MLAGCCSSSSSRQKAACAYIWACGQRDAAAATAHALDSSYSRQNAACPYIWACGNQGMRPPTIELQGPSTDASQGDGRCPW